MIEDYIFKITLRSPRGQWVKERLTPSRHLKLQQKKVALYQLKQKSHQTVAAFVLPIQAEA